MTGTVVLGGTLTLNFTGSYARGQKLLLIQAASISGSFSTLTSHGAAVVAGQDATGFYVTVQ